MKNWLVSAVVAGALVCPIAYATHDETAAEHAHRGDAVVTEKSHHEKHHHVKKKYPAKKKCHGKKKSHHKHHHHSKKEPHSAHSGATEEVHGEERIEQQMEKFEQR